MVKRKNYRRLRKEPTKHKLSPSKTIPSQLPYSPEISSSRELKCNSCKLRNSCSVGKCEACGVDASSISSNNDNPEIDNKSPDCNDNNTIDGVNNGSVSQELKQQSSASTTTNVFSSTDIKIQVRILRKTRRGKITRAEVIGCLSQQSSVMLSSQSSSTSSANSIPVFLDSQEPSEKDQRQLFTQPAQQRIQRQSQEGTTARAANSQMIVSPSTPSLLKTCIGTPTSGSNSNELFAIQQENNRALAQNVDDEKINDESKDTAKSTLEKETSAPATTMTTATTEEQNASACFKRLPSISAEKNSCTKQNCPEVPETPTQLVENNTQNSEVLTQTSTLNPENLFPSSERKQEQEDDLISGQKKNIVQDGTTDQVNFVGTINKSKSETPIPVHLEIKNRSIQLQHDCNIHESQDDSVSCAPFTQAEQTAKLSNDDPTPASSSCLEMINNGIKEIENDDNDEEAGGNLCQDVFTQFSYNTDNDENNAQEEDTEVDENPHDNNEGSPTPDASSSPSDETTNTGSTEVNRTALVSEMKIQPFTQPFIPYTQDPGGFYSLTQEDSQNSFEYDNSSNYFSEQEKRHECINKNSSISSSSPLKKKISNPNHYPHKKIKKDVSVFRKPEEEIPKDNNSSTSSTYKNDNKRIAEETVTHQPSVRFQLDQQLDYKEPFFSTSEKRQRLSGSTTTATITKKLDQSSLASSTKDTASSAAAPQSGFSSSSIGNRETLPQTVTTTTATAAVFFSTAGKGSVIQVSDEEMQKANNLLNGSSKSMNTTDRKQIPSTMSAPRSVKTSRSMFSIAGKKTGIRVSDENIQKVNNISNSSSNSRSFTYALNSVAEANIGKPQAQAMFSTAGKNSVIKVSDEELEKASNLLNGSSTSRKINRKNSSSRATSNILPTQAMFSTAGKGSVIKVSNEEMQKANNLLNGSSKVNKLQTAMPSALPSNRLPSTGAMFSTAGKRSVIQVSEADIQKANNLLNSTSRPTSMNRTKPSLAISNSSNGKSQFQATFSTAGKNSVIKVSDDEMDKANRLLNGSFTSSKHTTSKPLSTGTSGILPMRAMFNTAGKGAEIRVSEEDLQKANSLLNSNSKSNKIGATKSSSVSSVSNVTTPHTAFSTAGKKQAIHVSEKEMQEANRLLNSNRRPNTTTATKPSSINSVSTNRKTPYKKQQHSTPSSNAEYIKSSNSSQMDQNKNYKPVSVYNPYAIRKPTSYPRTPSTSSYMRKPVKVSDDKTKNHSFSRSTTSSRESTKTPVSVLPSKFNYNSNLKRSSGVINPYARKVVTDPKRTIQNPYQPVSKKPTTPKLPGFTHIAGTFCGRPLSPSSLLKAEKILNSQPRSERTPRPSSTRMYQSHYSKQIPTPKVLKYGDEKEEIKRVKEDDLINQINQGKKISLSKFAAVYGPLEDSAEKCLENCVSATTLKINSENASKLRFHSELRSPLLFFGDPHGNPKVSIGSVKDLHKDLTSSGCDEKLLSDKWIKNHYRWIVWKLASMERRFPGSLGGCYLTYDRVISQLRKRYEKELKGAIRPPLRKILNKDISANRPIILCVSQWLNQKSFSSNSDGSVRLELTDGWYSVQATLDQHLSSLVNDGKIDIGAKLLCNPEVGGSTDGLDPLDKNYDSSRSDCPVYFKLYTNSTRLAKWDSKLGFIHPSLLTNTGGLFMVKSLQDIRPDGGPVPLVEVVICRRQTRLFFEEETKSMLTEAEEHRARRINEKKRERLMEKVSESAQKEVEKKVDMDAPEEWKELMSSCSSQDLYESLPKDKKDAIDWWTTHRQGLVRDQVLRAVEDALNSEPGLQRTSKPFAKFEVRAINRTNNKCPEPPGRLTIWNIRDEQYNMLEEGTVIKLKNVKVKTYDNMLQLRVSSNTPIEISKNQPPQFVLEQSGYRKRSLLSMMEVHVLARTLNETNTEIDVLGAVLKITTVDNGSSVNACMYVSDSSGLVLRIDREFEKNQDPRKDQWIGKKVPNVANNVVALSDLALLYFDAETNCPVAAWTRSSYVTKKTKESKKIHELTTWLRSESGKQFCDEVKDGLCARLVLHAKIPSHEAVVGYIHGVSVKQDYVFNLEGSNSSLSEISPPLMMSIDGGSTKLINVDLPFFMLDGALKMCKEICPTFRYVYHEGITLCNLIQILKDAEDKFKRCGILFRFLLKRKPPKIQKQFDDSCLEVVQFEKVQTDALSRLLLGALKKN